MLTDAKLRNAKAGEKPYKLAKETGLYVIVNPKGSKYWRFDYSFGGKEKTISFGTYPLTPLSLARQRRDDARRLVAEGIDPSVHRQAQRKAQTNAVVYTFAAVVERWESDEMSRNSDEYRATVRRMLERDILPYLSERPVAQIKTS